MWRRILYIGLAFGFAFAILLISVFRTASVTYEFNPLVSSTSSPPSNEDLKIDYYLPYPGRVLPDSPLWFLKAIRDRLWLIINTNPTREAELILLLADKRIGSSQILFEKGEFDSGFSALTRAEKYLEEASNREVANRASGIDTKDFLFRIANASLKHYEITTYILNMSPDEAKPSIITIQEYPKKVFERARNALLERGEVPPKNPFDWE